MVVDTSVFIADALSRTRSNAASQLLEIASAGLFELIMCGEIRLEVNEVLSRVGDMSPVDITARYDELWSAAHWVTPVEEQAHHLAVVNRDAGDTMVVRAAEAIYQQLPELARAEDKFVVSYNRRHFRPGTSYAGFLFVTPRDLWRRIGE